VVPARIFNGVVRSLRKLSIVRRRRKRSYGSRENEYRIRAYAAEDFEPAEASMRGSAFE